jgi:hypothetical protein
MVSFVARLIVGRQMTISESLLADFLEQDEAAAELKVCERTLDRWRRLGEGPPITKLGRRVPDTALDPAIQERVISFLA